MTCHIELSEAPDRDLETILDILIESYGCLRSLRGFRGRGTADPDFPAGVRSLTKEGAVLCFEIGEDAEAIRLLAISLAGRNHRQRILPRAVVGTGR